MMVRSISLYLWEVFVENAIESGPFLCDGKIPRVKKPLQLSSSVVDQSLKWSYCLYGLSKTEVLWRETLVLADSMNVSQLSFCGTNRNSCVSPGFDSNRLF